MIRGSAIIEFGSGSVGSVAFINKEDAIASIHMRSCPPGKIGSRRGDKELEQLTTDDPEVVIYFTNRESLKSHIDLLTDILYEMDKCEEVEE